MNMPRLARSLIPLLPFILMLPQAHARELARPEPATLIWAGVEIVTFRANLAGHPPSARLDIARQALRRILADHEILEVGIERQADRSRFTVDGVLVFSLLPEDLLPEEELAQATAVVADNLRDAIQADQETETPGYLLRGWLTIIGACLLLALLLSALTWTRGWLTRRIARLAARRIDQLTAKGLPVIATRHLLEFIRAAILLISALLAIGATYLVVGFCLRVFPATRWFGNRMADLQNDTLADLGGAVLEALPGLLAVAIIFLTARFISQTLTFYFQRVEDGVVRNPWIDREVAAPTRRIAAFIVWVIAFGMSYPYLPGSGTEAFKGLGVLLGLMISLGASSLVGQAASGILILYSRALRLGEFVRVGGTEGTVVNLGMFTTRLRTVQNEEVSLPNSTLLADSIINFSRLAKESGLAVFTQISLGYDTPWRQVHALLLQAASATPEIEKDPAPFVLQTALDDFYVQYRLVVHIRNPEARGVILSQLHANILDAFNEAGVVITSPHYVADPPEPKRVPKTDWWRPPAAPN